MLLTLALGFFGCSQEVSVNAIPLEMGGAPMARLNRSEYRYTLRDLVGIDTDAGRWLPRDEEAYEFDTVTDVLTISTLHIESMNLAVNEALDAFFGPSERTYVVEAEGDWFSRDGAGQEDFEGSYAIQSGAIRADLELPFEGTYELSITGYGVDGGSPTLELVVDDESLGEMVFAVPRGQFQTRTVEAYLTPGPHQFTIKHALGTVAVDNLEVRGPLESPLGASPAYDSVVFCNPDELGDVCVEDILENFMRQAWRTPQEPEALTWAMDLYDLGLADGGAYQDGLRLAFKAILMAPEFVYRPEVMPEPAGPLPVSQHELAARLSYFLWSSTPDEELLVAAENGELGTAAEIQYQVDRMLRDERSEALVKTLAAQWLDIDLVDDLAPDEIAYRNFDDELRASMKEEMELMARDFLSGDINLIELLTKQESTIDGRLAEHYGILYQGDGWQPMSTEGTGRYGVLGTAGWLAGHSDPGRPDVVRRGKYVLSRLLCSSPPPPPPDIDQDIDFVQWEGSVREQEELQRSVEPCHTCHVEMDPIGFTMGKFDAIGAERGFDELGYAIDTEVQLGGQTMSSLFDIAAWVSQDPRLHRCVVEQTFTFALGRPPTELDSRNLDDITRRFIEQGATFPALVDALTTNPSFRFRAPVAYDEETL